MTILHELWMEAPAGVGALRLVAEDGALAAVHLAGAGDAPEGWERAPAADPGHLARLAARCRAEPPVAYDWRAVVARHVAAYEAVRGERVPAPTRVRRPARREALGVR